MQAAPSSHLFIGFYLCVHTDIKQVIKLVSLEIEEIIETENVNKALFNDVERAWRMTESLCIRHKQKCVDQQQYFCVRQVDKTSDGHVLTNKKLDCGREVT